MAVSGHHDKIHFPAQDFAFHRSPDAIESRAMHLSIAQPPIMESPPGAYTVIDGRRYLYFAGTSYFALHGHPAVIEAGIASLRKHGVHSGTTRAGFGSIAPVLEVEQRAAHLFARDAAFYFPSGYASNHVLVQALASDVDAVFVEDSGHFCVIEAARVAGLPWHAFRARDADDLRMQLKKHLRPKARPLVMGDAVVPTTGVLAPVQDYLDVLAQYDTGVLLLDDAHGFGVLGEHGRGLFEHVGLWDKVNLDHGEAITLAVGGTTAKALGGFGGIIPGGAQFITRARSGSHYFDGASAPASAAAGSTAKALELIISDSSYRQRVRSNAAQLRMGLRALGLEVNDSPAAQCGVVIGDAANMKRLHTALKERNILVPYVGAYSGIGSEGLMRFATSSAHTPEMIAHLLDTLQTLL